MAKKKLGIIVGHTRDKQGAYSKFEGGFTEYAYNKDVALSACDYALSLDAKKDQFEVSIIYRDHAGIRGAYEEAIYKKCDAVVELHFNSFSRAVTGTETLYPVEDPKDKNFAGLYQKNICKLFGRQGLSRGIKALSKGANGWFNVYMFPQGPNCLVEPFFGSSPKDAKLAIAKKEENL